MNLEDVTEFLEDVWEFLDEFADADWVGDPPRIVPNKAMKLKMRLEQLQAEAEAAEHQWVPLV